ncbi:hypothetical protein [Herbaspirillum sp. CF444]|uniref:hypothetical protein n=1 Tax=Herbaspirillum sp. CF444 TaxID=1144319 RepID=UPI0012F8251C|nr:hypothetical protein [Herbaspirillum sp. CF444]
MTSASFPLLLPRLKALAKSNPSSEVLELLWEVRRLRTLLRMDRLEIEAILPVALVVGGGIHAGIEKMHVRLKNESAAE